MSATDVTRPGALNPKNQNKPLVLDPKDPLTIAEKFVAARYEHDHCTTLWHRGGDFFKWNGSCYEVAEHDAIRSEVYGFLASAYREQRSSDVTQLVRIQPDDRAVNRVLDAMKAVIHLDATVASGTWLDNHKTRPPADELVACGNGLLHLLTMSLLRPTPRFFNTTALPVEFDLTASKPDRLLQFLQELWGSDAESIETLQEWFGYCLTTDTRLQKLLLIVGPKRSGKGTIGRVLRGLLGAANVAGPTLASLRTNFGLSALLDKTVGIISDARLPKRSDGAVIVERLLSMTGEDPITLDRKYRSHITVKLPTRIIILTNELPHLSDASGALVGRYIVLRLTESFFGHEDSALTDKLLRELPGILSWAIEGWKRLRERGHFIQPKSASEVHRDLEDLSSPIAAFITERCDVGPQHRVETRALYRGWHYWCEQQGYETGTRAIFGRDLRTVVPGLGKTRPRNGSDDRSYVYTGIGLKPRETGLGWSKDGLIVGTQEESSVGKEESAGRRTTLDQGERHGVGHDGIGDASPRAGGR